MSRRHDRSGDGRITGDLEIDALRRSGVTFTGLAGSDPEAAEQRIAVRKVAEAGLEHGNGVTDAIAWL